MEERGLRMGAIYMTEPELDLHLVLSLAKCILWGPKMLRRAAGPGSAPSHFTSCSSACDLLGAEESGAPFQNPHWNAGDAFCLIGAPLVEGICFPREEMLFAVLSKFCPVLRRSTQLMSGRDSCSLCLCA